MGIVLEPPKAAAGIHLGADRAEAMRQLGVHGEPRTLRRGDEAAPSLTARTSSGMSVFVYFDDADAVEAVEFGRPDRGETVTFDTIDVFGTPADEVTEELAQRVQVKVEEEGRSVTAPTLLLGLWRPTVPESPEDEEGRYFESVLVARPGYYD